MKVELAFQRHTAAPKNEKYNETPFKNKKSMQKKL